MTKRLLAIALVVMVAVSAMYLPSVLNVSAADEIVVVDKAAYDATIKPYTVTVNGNTTQIASLSAADIATEATLKAAIEREMPAYKDQVAAVVVTDSTVTVTLAKTIKFDVMSPTTKTPATTGEDIGDISVVVGSSVAEFTAKLPTPPSVYNKMFTHWDMSRVDGDYNGKVDDAAVATVTAVYTSVTGVYTVNAYVGTNAATAAQLTAGTYTLASPTVFTSFTANPTLYNAVDATTDAATGHIATPEAVLADGSYEFSYWLVRNTPSVTSAPVFNSKDYIAIYKKAAGKGIYEYIFKDGVDEAALTPPGTAQDFGKDANSLSVRSNTLTANPYELLTADQKKVITDYLTANNKTISSWTIVTTGTANQMTVTLVPNALTEFTYYYIDANGNYAKATEKFTSPAAAISRESGEAKGHTFVKWSPTTDNAFNSTYTKGEPVVEVILPEAKKGNDSFAFSSTATPKTAKYKKTMVARVTAGKGTFNKAEVKLVNKTVKLSANAINCTVKKGTMKETSGTPYTITFNKKGTAYVVVSIAYNGNVYTKTLTKTVK